MIDEEKKRILIERKALAKDCLDHAKESLIAGATEIAIRSIEMAYRQVEHWPTEF